MLAAGTRVRVRPEAAIRLSLDAEGRLDGLPFMDEMWAWCGREAVVERPVVRLLVEGTGYRELRDTWLLVGARCDGSAHGGCRRRCTLLWKGAWLEPLGEGAAGDPSGEAEAGARGGAGAGGAADAPCQGQGAVLLAASRPAGTLRVGTALRELRAGLLTPAGLGLRLARMGLDRLRWQARKLPAAVEARRRRVVPPSPPLAPGQLVRVRSWPEIRRTLDARQKLRGLHFADAMRAWCGRTTRILDRVDRYRVEETGRFVTLRDTWLLEDAWCDGSPFHDCPRRCLWLWRGAWLEPVEGGP